jgi:hypothetical protein
VNLPIGQEPPSQISKPEQPAEKEASQSKSTKDVKHLQDENQQKIDKPVPLYLQVPGHSHLLTQQELELVLSKGFFSKHSTNIWLAKRSCPERESYIHIQHDDSTESREAPHMVPVRPSSSMASRNCEERMSTIIWGTNTDNTIPSINISLHQLMALKLQVLQACILSASQSPETVKMRRSADETRRTAPLVAKLFNSSLNMGKRVSR